MLHQRAALVSVVIAGFWPAGAVYAADLAALASSEIAVRQSPLRASVQPQSSGARPASFRPGRYAMASLSPAAERDSSAVSGASPSVAADGVRPGRAAPGEYRLDESRDGLSTSAGIESGLALAASSLMNRTGWTWSGRLGPVRWLGPLDGEGETMLRLRRIPGQPRIQGVGRFHVGIHYTFE